MFSTNCLKKAANQLFNRVAPALASARFAIAVLAMVAAAALGVTAGGALAAEGDTYVEVATEAYGHNGRTYNFQTFTAASAWTVGALKLDTNSFAFSETVYLCDGAVSAGSAATFAASCVSSHVATFDWNHSGYHTYDTLPLSGGGSVELEPGTYTIYSPHYAALNPNVFAGGDGYMCDGDGDCTCGASCLDFKFAVVEGGNNPASSFSVAASHSPAAPDYLTPTSFGGTFSVTGTLAGSARVLLDGNLVKECVYSPAVASGSCMTDPAALPAGSHTVTLQVSGDGGATWHAGGETFTVASAAPAAYGVDRATPVAPGGTLNDGWAWFQATLSGTAGTREYLAVRLTDLTSSTVSTLSSDAVTLDPNVAVVSGVYSEHLADHGFAWDYQVVPEGQPADPNAWIPAPGRDVLMRNFSVYFQKDIKLGVILAKASDVNYFTVPTDAPCKLPGGTVDSAHPMTYYQEIGRCLTDYYQKNSYDRVTVSVIPILPGGGREWYSIAAHDTEYYYKFRLWPLPTTDRGSEFAGDAIAASGADESLYDAIAVVGAPIFRPFNNGGTNRITLRNDSPLGIWVHETGHVTGSLITPHQTALPDLYDDALDRRVGNWDVMAEGQLNGPGVNSFGFVNGKKTVSDGTDPAELASVSRVFLGWLHEDIHPKSAYSPIGTPYVIKPLESSHYGDGVLRYNLEDSDSPDVSKYYLVESRTRDTTSNTWSRSMPGTDDADVILYYSDSRNESMYGSGAAGRMRFVTVLANDQASSNSGVLNPQTGSGFVDPVNRLAIRATLVDASQPMGDVAVSIRNLAEACSEFLPDSHEPYNGAIIRKEMSLAGHVNWGKDINGMVAIRTPYPEEGETLHWEFYKQHRSEPLDYLVGNIITLIYCLVVAVILTLALWAFGRLKALRKRRWYAIIKYGATVLCIVIVGAILVLYYRFNQLNPADRMKRDSRFSVPYGVTYGLPAEESSVGSLAPDLHLWCDDGRHVGLDYATGQFENDFPDALVSGPMGGAPEWIYVPATVTGCRYSVSSYQEQQWLAANPELASQLTDTTDTYELSAGVIDPALGIFESATVAGSITPGQDVNYDLTGSGADIGVSAGAAAPRTDAALSGERDLATGEFIGPVAVSLTSEPGAVTSYSLNGGVSWTGYAGPFAVAAPGATLLQYRSVGADGSQELTKSLSISIVSPDAVAPALSVVSPLDGYLTAAASVDVTGSAPDAGSGLATVAANGAACALDGDAFSCAGVPLAEGPNEIALFATDAAGNATSINLHVSRDSVAPDTAVDSAPSGWTASTEAIVGFSADEPGSAFLCSLDGAAAAPCLSPATLSGLADGAHTFAVHAVDTAGNADLTPALAEWSVDATAPVATIASPVSGLLTNSSSVDVMVAASDSGSGVASVAVGETACATSAPGLWSCAAVPLAEGDNEVTVTVTDLAGNSSSASVAVTSDTVAPSASGAAASLASGSVSASVSLSDASGIASVSAAVRGPLPSSAAAMTFALARDAATGSWSASAALPPQSATPDGRYEVTITATDAAGNAATFAAGSFSLDRSSPEAPDVSVAPSVARPGAAVAVAVSAADASSGVASVTVRDTATGSVVSLTLTAGDAASGTWSGDLVAALPEGEHSLMVTVTDAEGNATAASSSFSVDATAPSIAMTSIPPALTNSAAASVAFSSGDGTAAFLCTIDGAEPVACASPFAVAALADGAHSVAVTATDPAGNVSVAASASWTVDTAAPDTAITSGPAAASLTRSATFSLSATEPGSSYLCILDGAAPVACASPYQLSALADGPHLLSVSATDPAGNVDATPAEWRWSVAAPVCPVLAASGAFSLTCAENPDGSTLVSLVGDKWRQTFAVLLPFGASPAAPRATVAVTADDHNRNKPALSFLASLPAAAHASLTVPRGHASATYACVGAASLEIGPGCSGTRITIPAPGQSAAFATGRNVSTSADGASVTVTGY